MTQTMPPPAKRVRGTSPDDELIRRALASAEWIGPGDADSLESHSRPAYLLRRDFTIDAVVETAWLTATAHGVYEVFVNGERVDDDELKPGFSSYRSRLAVQRFDVTHLLHEGTNAIGVVLSDGWFRGRHGFERRRDGFGRQTETLLSIEGTDGPLVVSDSEWLVRESWITAADLMDGQHEDRRQYDSRWSAAGTDLSAWRPVRASGRGSDHPARLFAEDRPPIRRIERLQPLRIDWNVEGGVVVDFGQNINGWVRLATLGPAGTNLTLTHGEHVDINGRVNTEHLRAFRFSDRTLLDAGQVDRVISSGKLGDVFEPRHTTHGFRYVQIDGYPNEVDLDIAAVVVHSDLDRSGGFASSDPELDALHHAVEWSFRGNACGLPTDCPQRERSGFTGDWQVFVETAGRMFDVAEFSRSWMRDLAADQWRDGRVPTVIPNPAGAHPSGIAFEDMSAGSAGWGDAAVIVPWELWRRTGDVTILEEFFPVMRAWVDFATEAAASGRHPDRVRMRPQPHPDEAYLWDTGFHFGEWLEPGVAPNPDPRVDHSAVATAFLHRSAHLLALTAVILEEPEAAERYRTVADGALRAWRAEFLVGEGEIAIDSQATYARALTFGLLPEGQRKPAASRLARLVEAAENTVGTGFLSTGQLLPALADHGQSDIAFALLRSHRAPSWLAMLDRGATTMWEWWDGVDGEQVRGSLNHYSKGAVAGFLHSHLAGLRVPQEPTAAQAGGRLVLIEPMGFDVVDHASCYLDLPPGRASVSWVRAGDKIKIDFTVPGRAMLRLPGGEPQLFTAGSYTLAVIASDYIRGE